jgi:deazaflavin-dependent oxidoreductase (nitroreductase family)
MPTTTTREFRPQTSMEKAFNRLFGFMVGLGIGPHYAYLLQVRGRKSGRLYSTPVSLVTVGDKRYLVAPRGRTQWVRNAEVAGEIALKRGSYRGNFELKPVPDAAKPAILKIYLDSYKAAVQRFFSVPAGSNVGAFVPIAANYPVFELELRAAG